MYICVCMYVCKHVAARGPRFSNHLHVWNLDSTERPGVKLDAVQHKCISSSSSSSSSRVDPISYVCVLRSVCVADGLKTNMALLFNELGWIWILTCSFLRVFMRKPSKRRDNLDNLKCDVKHMAARQSFAFSQLNWITCLSHRGHPLLKNTINI